MRQDIIDIATAEIGTTEDPPGSNLTKYGEWFGLNGKEWCGIFCSWCYAQSGNPLGTVDFLKGFASIPFALKHWHDKTTDPQPADLVIFDWQKGKVAETEWSPDHVGLFKEWIDKSAGTFYTIEGNTSSGNNSNGGAVQLRQRNMAFVEAFINPLNL